MNIDIQKLPLWEKPLKDYELVEPYGLQLPWYTGHVSSWNKETAKKHFEWFIRMIPERVAMLERVVQSNLPDVGFKADYSLGSLGPLSEWLNAHITFTIPSVVEQYGRANAMEKQAEAIEQKAGERKTVAHALHDKAVAALLRHLQKDSGEPWPSHETLSLVYDAGIYVGEMLRRANPNVLAWDYRKQGSHTDGYYVPTLKLPKRQGSSYDGISFIGHLRPSYVTYLEGKRIDAKKTLDQMIARVSDWYDVALSLF